MLHIDLNLNPAIEQQLLQIVQQQFQGSFEAFIQDSLKLQTVTPDEWDKKIEQDSNAGKLDFLINTAFDEYHAGTTRSL